MEDTVKKQEKNLEPEKGKKPEKSEKPKKDLSKIHGVVNHTGIKVGASIFMLLIVGASAFATYKFAELDYKSPEEYAGVAFMWIGIIAFSYLLVAEIIMKDNFFTMMSEMYHYEKPIYYLLLALGISFFITFTLLIYSNITRTEPLNLKYERHCPIGTQYGKNYKHPKDTS